jgi:hypothetical protein
MAFPLSFTHRIQQLLIFQQFVYQPHPRRPQVFDIFGQTLIS